MQPRDNDELAAAQAEDDRAFVRSVQYDNKFPWPSYTRAYLWWKWKRVVFDETLHELRSKSGPVRLLDIGCSLGKDLFSFERLCPDRAIDFHGFDLSPSAIRHAVKRAGYENRNNYHFDQGEAWNLPYESETFDIVWCQDVVEHLTEPELCFREGFRVCKPGGLAIFSTPNGGNNFLRIKYPLGKKARKPKKAKPTEALKFDKFGEPESYGHISVRPIREWVETAKQTGFQVQRVRRGAPLQGTDREDRHRILFAGLLVLDWVLDHLPGTTTLSEHFIMILRKP